MDRTSPMDKHMEVMINRYGLEAAPAAPQMFGNAGKEHMEKYGAFLLLVALIKTQSGTVTWNNNVCFYFGAVFIQAQNRNTLPKLHGKTTNIPPTTRKFLFAVTSKSPVINFLSKHVTICAGTHSSRMSTVWSRW